MIPITSHGFVRFYRGTAEEVKTIARISGRRDVHDLDLSDVFTTSVEVARFSDIDSPGVR